MKIERWELRRHSMEFTEDKLRRHYFGIETMNGYDSFDLLFTQDDQFYTVVETYKNREDGIEGLERCTGKLRRMNGSAGLYYTLENYSLVPVGTDEYGDTVDIDGFDPEEHALYCENFDNPYLEKAYSEMTDEELLDEFDAASVWFSDELNMEICKRVSAEPADDDEARDVVEECAERLRERL